MREGRNEMNRTWTCAILIIFALTFDCAGQLAIKQITAESTQLERGEETKIYVVFNGPNDKVASVEATVREAPEVYYILNNDGKNGDEKEGDNIWTCTAQVPWEADSGTYHLDISALDADGNEILLESSEKQNEPRRGTIEVTVK